MIVNETKEIEKQKRRQENRSISKGHTHLANIHCSDKENEQNLGRNKNGCVDLLAVNFIHTILLLLLTNFLNSSSDSSSFTIHEVAVDDVDNDDDTVESVVVDADRRQHCCLSCSCCCFDDDARFICLRFNRSATNSGTNPQTYNFANVQRMTNNTTGTTAVVGTQTPPIQIISRNR